MAEKRYQSTITFNKGLDKASLPFEGDPSRALDEMNYVYRDDKVQKRYGYNELLSVPTTYYKPYNFGGFVVSSYRFNSREFNGLWHFTAEDGNRHLIAHIGKLLYEINELNGVWEANPIVAASGTETHDGHVYVKCYEFENYKSVAVIGNKSLYFFGGNKLMRLRYPTSGTCSFKPVEDDSDTYVPTTTISIAEDGAEVSQRASLDEVNLMTQYRKNQLIGGAIEQHKSPNVHRFVLDAPVVSSDENPVPKVKVKASCDESIFFDVTTQPALEAATSELLPPTPASANLATCDLVLINSNTGESVINPTLTIVEGEPTRKEAFFPETYLQLKVRITFWDEETASTPDGPVYSRTEISSYDVDFNWFVRYSLMASTHHALSWESGASLSAYDESALQDQLVIAFNISPLRCPNQHIDTNVKHFSSVTESEMKGILLSNSIDIEIPYGNEKTKFEGVKGLLIDESDNGSWASSLTGTVSLTKSLLYAFTSGSNIIYGVILNYGNTDANGEIVLFGDWRQQLGSYTNNIEVTFPCYVSKNADKINKCRIAKLFGNANAKNRLFVSGNPDYPNCDWHSSARNESLEIGKSIDSNGDFTYFGDMDYCFYGQTDNAVMGYDIVSTNKMIVLKSKSKVEPTNYFRSSSLIQALSGAGSALTGIDGSALYQESFPCDTGNIGAGAMNNRSVVNLNGDTLYLSSENTICGLDLIGQVGDSQRIANSRSEFIDPELKELDLSDAVLWTDNSSLYLFASDCSYMTNYKTLNNLQYEWFKIDVKGVRCAIDIDDVMYFATADGSFYRFEKGVYFDNKKIYIQSGGALYVSLVNDLYGNNEIAYDSSINSLLDESKHYEFEARYSSLETSLFRRVASFSSATGNNVDITLSSQGNRLKIVARDANGVFDADRYAELLEEFCNDSSIFYFDKPDGEEAIGSNPGNTIATYTPYHIVKTDQSDEFKLTDLNGDEVSVEYLSRANVCALLNGRYEVSDLDKENCTFKLKENGRELDVILYADQDLSVASFECELQEHSNVEAYFIASPAVLHGISYKKTIWQWTMTAFKEPNDLQVCQATNEKSLDEMASLAFADSIPIGLNFRDFSILETDFVKSVVPRKYSYFRPISVPFISFGFRSLKSANSILTATSIIYTIPMLGRGDK